MTGEAIIISPSRKFPFRPWLLPWFLLAFVGREAVKVVILIPETGVKTISHAHYYK
jgi:hypothetical protein